MSPATRAGPTCRCPARSSRCSSASSRLPAPAPPSPTHPTRRPRPCTNRWRRPACLTASAASSPPSATARPVPTDYSASATADHPPGFYGPPENLLAVNTLSAGDRLTPLDFSPLRMRSREIYRKTEPQDLRGPVLLAALGLFLLDTLIVALSRRRHRQAAAARFARAARRRSSCPRWSATVPHARADGRPARSAALGAGDQARLRRHRRRATSMRSANPDWAG